MDRVAWTNLARDVVRAERRIFDAQLDVVRALVRIARAEWRVRRG